MAKSDDSMNSPPLPLPTLRSQAVEMLYSVVRQVTQKIYKEFNP